MLTFGWLCASVSLAAPALRTPLSMAGSYPGPFAMMGHHEMNGSLTSPGVYAGLHISPQMSAAAAAAYGRPSIVSVCLCVFVLSYTWALYCNRHYFNYFSFLIPGIEKACWYNENIKPFMFCWHEKEFNAYFPLLLTMSSTGDKLLYDTKCEDLMSCLLAFFKAGFDHPHMRAPGLPASLTSISGGKPWVS